MSREVQIVFQDPYSSLNPRKTVGSIIGEPFAIHGLLREKGERKREVQRLMETVGLNPEHYNRYPHPARSAYPFPPTRSVGLNPVQFSLTFSCYSKDRREA